MKKVSQLLFVLLLVPAAVFGQPGDPIRDFLGETFNNEARISPDGRRVAFVAYTNDFERDREDIALWLVDLERRVSPREIWRGSVLVAPPRALTSPALLSQPPTLAAGRGGRQLQ